MKKIPPPFALIATTAFRRPLLALLLLPVLGSASAATLQLDIDTVFSGPGLPEGTTPWIAVTLDDSFGDDNTVRLTMDATGLAGDEYAASIYLNFDPALDSTNLSFTQIANPTGLDPTTDIHTGTDMTSGFKANGDGYFDILFDFPPPPGSSASKFTIGEVVVFDLKYTSAISAGSFAYQSVDGGTPGSNPFASSHIQKIGPDQESAFTGAPDAVFVPEPSSTALLGLGGLALMLRRRR